jgi:pyruvate/2-oxoglutarate dehydrogenase complex dihydrolipoamide acyltransferase (E2) component
MAHNLRLLARLISGEAIWVGGLRGEAQQLNNRSDDDQRHSEAGQTAVHGRQRLDELLSEHEKLRARPEVQIAVAQLELSIGSIQGSPHRHRQRQRQRQRQKQSGHTQADSPAPGAKGLSAIHAKDAFEVSVETLNQFNTAPVAGTIDEFTLVAEMTTFHNANARICGRD